MKPGRAGAGGGPDGAGALRSAIGSRFSSAATPSEALSCGLASPVCRPCDPMGGTGGIGGGTEGRGGRGGMATPFQY